MEERGFIRQQGNYKKLLSYQKAEVVYDITHCFCRRFLEKRDRTVDQMIRRRDRGSRTLWRARALRGLRRKRRSRLGVARSSLDELLNDYHDYLRVRGLPLWDKDSKEATYVRKLSQTAGASYESFRQFVETRPAGVVANIAICMIHQANYLLDRQLRRLEQDFLRTGGVRENMTNARVRVRKRQRTQSQDPSDPLDPSDP